MDLHFFQYVGGTASEQTAVLNSLFNNAVMFGYFGGSISETSATPGNHGEVKVNFSGNSFGTLAKLNDGVATTLDDSTSVFGGSLQVTWALEWDLSIAAGGSRTLSTTLSVAPEPGAMALVSLGFAAFTVTRRKRRRQFGAG